MIEGILKKRTRHEKYEWQKVKSLIPRGRKTRGIQYETLEYLFENLYEWVSEEQLRNHLIEVKGHLQATGDPVKGAINLAIKELQRLPDATFEILKIQRSGHGGRTKRYVRLIFKEDKANFEYGAFVQFLNDLLDDSSDLVLRCVSPSRIGPESDIFPGLLCDERRAYGMEALLAEAPIEPKTATDDRFRFMPVNQGLQHVLLIYHKDLLECPVVACVAKCGQDIPRREWCVLVHRGEEKLAELKFLHDWWHRQHATSLPQDEWQELLGLAERAVSRLGEIPFKLEPSLLHAALVMRRSQHLAQPRITEQISLASA